MYLLVPITHWLHQLKLLKVQPQVQSSTLTRDVAEHGLAVERSKQFEKSNYQRPKAEK